MSVKITVLFALTSLTVAGVTATKAHAQTEPVPNTRFGAFFYQEYTGAQGYSVNHASKEDAEANAELECAVFGSGCKHIVTFQGCAAFAEWRKADNEFVYAYSYNYRTLSEALNAAMQTCVEKNRGYKCGITMYACNE